VYSWEFCFIGANNYSPLQDIKLFGGLTDNSFFDPKQDSLQKDIGCLRNIRCLENTFRGNLRCPIYVLKCSPLILHPNAFCFIG
jgi:hypothetical protein